MPLGRPNVSNPRETYGPGDGGVWRPARTANLKSGSYFRPVPKDAVPELARLLKDPDVFVRRDVATALGGIGLAAKDAAPELAKLLKGPR